MINLFIHFIFPFPDFNDIIFNIVRRQNRKTTSYGGQPQQRQQCEPFIIGSSCSSNKGKTMHEKTMQIQFIFYFPNDYCNLGVFAKNTSRETNHFPSRKLMEF
jgi:hypothetical protein